MAQISDGTGDRVMDRDLVRTYLAEIGRTPLLDAAQEVELAKTVEAGLYGERLLADRRAAALAGERAGEWAGATAGGPAGDPAGDPAGAHTPTDEELERLAEAGRLAKDAFLRANLRLVVSVARRYTGRGVPFLDLIQEG